MVIPDKLFKSLKHSNKGFKKYLNGQSLEQGYKPDFVMKNGNDYVILECENTSSRKTFVGGLLKAAHFFQNDKKGILVFVIVPKKNTSAFAIAKHLKVYLNWIQSKTNLRKVFVIDASHYYKDDCVLSLDCEDFSDLAFQV